MKATFWIAAWIGVTSLTTSRADIVDVFGGTYGNWPSAWTSLDLDDGDDGDGANAPASYLDIRGNTSYPAAAYAQDNNFIYFRLQLEAATFDTTKASGSYLVYVDHVGSGGSGRPDFGFAWDASNNNNANHGLEMNRFKTAGSTWGSLYMDDVDGSFSSKGVNDINGNSRTGDGYLRVLRQQTGVGGSAANSYIEIAVAWNYLENYSTTGLGRGQSWKIAFGNIGNATDHGAINQNGDVAGGLTYESSLASGWSADISTVPEIPASPWLVLGFAGLAAVGGRLHSTALGWWRSLRH